MVECFNCGGDHFARDCPQGGGKKGGGKGKGGGKSVDCFNCGGPHFARDCPQGGGKGGGKGGGWGGGGKGGGGGGICYDFRDKGSCRFGESCRFSHEMKGGGMGGGKGGDKSVNCFGPHFARDYPQRSSEGKGKGGAGGGICYGFPDKGSCLFGESCHFSHNM